MYIHIEKLYRLIYKTGKKMLDFLLTGDYGEICSKLFIIKRVNGSKTNQIMLYKRGRSYLLAYVLKYK